MDGQTPEIRAAREFASQAASKLRCSSAFAQLPAATQQVLLNDLGTIRSALEPSAEADATSEGDPYALTLESPRDYLARRRRQARLGDSPRRTQQPIAQPTQRRQAPSTQTIAERTGALIDEVDFPGFVSGLVHGTFDAIVDASIRQMEAFADLVSAVAKDADQFTQDHVTANQTRDWLVEQYPNDVRLAFDPRPRLQSMPTGEDDEPRTPSWLADFNLGGEELSDELLEEQLVPQARQRLGNNRLQMLATMVLMGMNRINVTDGSISARVRFRAAARDKTAVDYASSQDPGGASSWGQRGRSTSIHHSTMISTVGVNAQADSGLKAELFGQVQINFASETLPLDRFVEQAQLTLLQRNARVAPAEESPPPATPTTLPPASTAEPSSRQPTPVRAPDPTAPNSTAPEPGPPPPIGES